MNRFLHLEYFIKGSIRECNRLLSFNELSEFDRKILFRLISNQNDAIRFINHTLKDLPDEIHETH